MKRRTLSLDDLQTLAAVCHAYDAIDWPPRDEGGWATATLNGHPYRARVAPEPAAERVKEES